MLSAAPIFAGPFACVPLPAPASPEPPPFLQAASARGTAAGGGRGLRLQRVPASSAGGSAQGTAGGTASSDRRSMSGKVMKVDPGAGTIMLDPSTSPAMVVIIDQNTRILDPNGQVMSN